MEHPFPCKIAPGVSGCTWVHPYMMLTIKLLNPLNNYVLASLIR